MAITGDTCACQSWEGRRASGGQRPGVLLRTLGCTGRPIIQPHMSLEPRWGGPHWRAPKGPPGLRLSPRERSLVPQCCTGQDPLWTGRRWEEATRTKVAGHLQNPPFSARCSPTLFTERKPESRWGLELEQEALLGFQTAHKIGRASCRERV